MDNIFLRITELIKEVKPFDDISEDTDLIKSEILSSVDLFELISLIEDEYDLQISGEYILPENFKNIDVITKLTKRLMGE